MQKILAVGLMSGTSLDGLDIAACEFSGTEDQWHYRILDAITVGYSEKWQERLRNIHTADALAFWKCHVEYGHYIGQQVKAFLASNGLHPRLVCSHGHTVFHQPGSGYTMQMGAGEAIAAETGLPVVCDFRSADVALGGQGAPLVPMGDRLLFQQYGACLNLGGFSNVSYELQGQRIAFDICPVNIVLNRLASLAGEPFDKDGLMARFGNLDNELFERLNKLDYYSAQPPKSLGREWLEDIFFPMLLDRKTGVSDLLRTVCEHIARQVGKSLDNLGPTNVLITGGGAHNRFLVETIRKYSHHRYLLPDTLTIDFKEALIFALLGVLRFKGKVNILASVTGGNKDLSGGALYDLFR